jgi:uncharacterized protein (TIGR00255 family)
MTKPTELHPVRSMTGFARVTGSCQEVDLEVEIKSVNHRFFEVAVKAPRARALLERDIGSILRGSHRRGRFDVAVYRRINASSIKDSTPLSGYDVAVARYSAACKRFGAGSDGLAQFIGALVLKDLSAFGEGGEISDEEHREILNLTSRASDALKESRAIEGAAISTDISRRISAIDSMRDAIATRVAKSPERFHARLTEKLAGLSSELKLDPERLALEVAILADRVDISEELTRLSIHLNQFQNLLKAGHSDGVGRKLDFTLQEIGRELNTIGSKVQDADAQGIVVEAKAELERAREQVQNVE